MSSSQWTRYEVRGPHVLMKHVREVLDERGSSTTKEIADALDCNPSTARDAVYRLEQNGEVDRRWDVRRPSRHIWVPTGDLDV